MCQQRIKHIMSYISSQLLQSCLLKLCQAVCRDAWVLWVVFVVQLVKHGARNAIVQFLENTHADRPWLHCKDALGLDGGQYSKGL